MLPPLLDRFIDLFDGPSDFTTSPAEPLGGVGRVDPRLLEQTQATLDALAELYAEASAETVTAGVLPAGQEPDEFQERMQDLRRGLLLRIFLEIAGVDWSWQPGELALARVLVEDLWGRHLDDERLRPALEQLRAQAPPEWAAVLRPFRRLPAFRLRRDELLAHALRLANLFAKADGKVTSEEKRQLTQLRTHLENHLKPLTLAGEPEPLRAGAQALQTEEAAAKEAARVAALPPLPAAAKPSGPTLKTATPIGPKPADQRFAEAQAELNSLIGLTELKAEIQSLMNFLKMQRERVAHGLPETKISLHSVFEGNPGTGKTTVARLMGKLLGALGILAKGHLVETDRSGLVAEYAGQTGPKANKKIDEALDGVLFIDEAYSLVAEKGDDPYGQEAVQTLLKRMEDNRDRLVVILAGYPAPLRRLLRSNPGLSSRFNRTFNFPDYRPLELCQILETLAAKCQYVLPGPTRAKLIVGFGELCKGKDEHFGNGRLVRNLYERSVTRLADRLVGAAPLTKELLTRLEPADLAFDDVPAPCWQALEAGKLRFAVACPGCKQASGARAEHLGQRLHCKRCRCEFEPKWGEVAES